MFKALQFFSIFLMVSNLVYAQTNQASVYDPNSIYIGWACGFRACNNAVTVNRELIINVSNSRASTLAVDKLNAILQTAKRSGASVIVDFKKIEASLVENSVLKAEEAIKIK